MIQLIIQASLSSVFFGLFGVSWDSVDRKIENEFPDVEFISSEQLKAKQAETQSSPLIFDVREPEEFKVSHLPYSSNLSDSAAIAKWVPNKNAEIVVYCSVGYRSAAIADELAALGYTNVLNLRHSIFEWAEKGYPLANSEGATVVVHPYNRAWGALIDDSLHQYP